MIDDVYKYNSVDLAYYIVALANKCKIVVNVTKVQKLLYLVYGAFLAIYGERVCNERPQAWPYGPVFPKTRIALINMGDLYKISLSEVSSPVENDTELKKVIDFVFAGFGKKTAGQLTVWSHRIGSPWERTTHTPGFQWGMDIPDQYIRSYFATIIKINGTQPEGN